MRICHFACFCHEHLGKNEEHGDGMVGMGSSKIFPLFWSRTFLKSFQLLIPGSLCSYHLRKNVHSEDLAHDKNCVTLPFSKLFDTDALGLALPLCLGWG